MTIAMEQLIALFDMDGVMIDTESQYDLFWIETAKKYKIATPNFHKIIKGTTMEAIVKNHLAPVLVPKQVDEILAASAAFESTIPFPEIEGSIDFVKALKGLKIKVGLVTSSSEIKLDRLKIDKHFDTLFDTIVSASRVKKGKPDPECYLLAAKELGATPSQCVVFEDSLSGIQAGVSAGMKVIGLTTTYPESAIKDKCVATLPNFAGMTYGKLLGLLGM